MNYIHCLVPTTHVHVIVRDVRTMVRSVFGEKSPLDHKGYFWVEYIRGRSLTSHLLSRVNIPPNVPLSLKFSSRLRFDISHPSIHPLRESWEESRGTILAKPQRWD